MSKLAYKKILAIIFLPLFLAAAFTAGVYVGFEKNSEVKKITSVLNQESPEPIPDADFAPFWKVWNLINEKSPNSKVTNQEKIWGATEGLASSLGDPYTVFFPPQEDKLFKDQISGSFGGVGMEVGIKEKVLTVISPLKGSPAEKAGIKAGDKIIKIDSTSTTDLSVDKAIALIRGKEGTTVKLTIMREGVKESKEYTVTRAAISIPTIETKFRDDGIFVITLYSFSQNSANLFREALREFIKVTKNGKLILDLRDNPGGYLDAAVDMTSWFLPAGKTVVIEDFGGNKENHIYRSKGYDIFTENLKMVILVDGGSASASEILAGALKEHSIAKLIGEKTYGKGSVQELIDVTENTSLKITVAKWLTPNGISISEHGLDPDIVVKAGTDKDKDPQMDKAIEFLNK